MRMKDRFCRIGKHLLGAACLLSTCGVTYSCSDDYDLDETRPAFLGQSIYDELKARDKFSTVIRLIDDLDYKEVLSKTGSKTLFVADDAAYSQFFANNPWGVKSYDDLSLAQKRLLLKSSMLDNAYVLEMMTTIQGPVKNLCLRQLSSVSVTDSIPYFRWNKLPNNLNNVDGNAQTPDPRYWDELRQQSRGGVYMALDKTVPMLTHFLQAQMKEKSITNKDISFILGLDGTSEEWNTTENRSYIYDARVIEPDVTCLNGYFHVLNKVLVTPGTMAEVIRKNPKDSLFSAMLERFSLPNFDATLNSDFKGATGSVADTAVYQKLYVAQRGQKGAIAVDIHNKSLGANVSRLSFDPGWNAYNVDNTTKEQDMGVMFVPNNDAMVQYFCHGAGASLIESYGDKENTSANLLHNLYQIPQNIIVKMLNNLMKESFNATVPSKYRSIMNSAQDQMFSTYATEEAYKAAMDTVMLASNGVVYVMKDMITPPDYASVSGPVLFNDSTRVMNTAIHADDNFVKTNFSNAPLRKFYSTYLLAMQSHFSLFVPVDKGFTQYGYVDPMSFASGNASAYRYWAIIPDNTASSSASKSVALKAQAYRYSLDAPLNAAGDRSLGSTYVSNSSDNVDNTGSYGPVKKQMITDMVDQHIVVHGEGNGAKTIEGNKDYYLSRSGAPVFVSKHGNVDTGTGMVVEGGFQRELFNTNNPTHFTSNVVKGYNLSTNAEGKEIYGNGHTYFINRPMQPTVYNVYQMMYRTTSEIKENSKYSKFFDLCKTLIYGSNEEMLKKVFLINTDLADKNGNVKDESKWNTEKNKYAIFAKNGSGGRLTANGSSLVRFFNNYRYTIFLPSDEAVAAAIEKGLPTIEDIENFVSLHCSSSNWDGEKDEATGMPVNQLKAQAMYTCLVNFIKYHFCDQSYFVDKFVDNAYTTSQSACTDSKTNTFINVSIKHANGGVMEVRDAAGRVSEVTTDAQYNNIFARDYELNASASQNPKYIKSSSYAVLHGLKGKDFLLFDSSWNAESSRFDTYWVTSQKAKAFVKRFELKK